MVGHWLVWEVGTSSFVAMLHHIVLKQNKPTALGAT